jgi:hypothetical protein
LELRKLRERERERERGGDVDVDVARKATQSHRVY